MGIDLLKSLDVFSRFSKRSDKDQKDLIYIKKIGSLDLFEEIVSFLNPG